MNQSNRALRVSMGMLMVCVATACRLTAAPTSQSSDPNSIHSGALWLDTAGEPIHAHGGSILLHDGVYYWFGEHHAQVRSDRSFRVYSSTDLANWKDLGDALKVSTQPGDPLEVGSVLERPRVLFNATTGKFVMYFHHEPKGTRYAAAHAAVALADRPEGPYHLLRSDRVNKGIWPMNWRPTTAPAVDPVKLPKGLEVHAFTIGDPKFKELITGFNEGQSSRDMTVFQDDDGKAYQIYSSEGNLTLQIAELSDDYLSYTGRYVRALENRQREASAMFKHDGKYFLFTSLCTGWKPNAADVAVADSIWGPWKSLGNPWQGPADQTKISFDSQSTFVLQIANGRVLFMADRWRPTALDSSGYIWFPVDLSGAKPILHWADTWDIRDILR